MTLHPTSRTLTFALPARASAGLALLRAWRTLCALRVTRTSKPALTTAAPSAAPTALSSSRMSERALALGFLPSLALTVLRLVPEPPWRELRGTPCVRHLL